MKPVSMKVAQTIHDQIKWLEDPKTTQDMVVDEVLLLSCRLMVLVTRTGSHLGGSAFEKASIALTLAETVVKTVPSETELAEATVDSVH